MQNLKSTLTHTVMVLTILTYSLSTNAQNKKYSRKKVESAPAASSGAAKPSATAAATATSTGATTAQSKDSEKLDIQELEQKYWAPKDTDFSVVQNRTYTKAKRVAASLMTGPIVNDPFNTGLTHSLNVNYYLDERYGFEFMYQTSDLSDSDATKDFKKSIGGGLRPDFNRDTSFYGLGFNYVPFYAKMSFLGKKIIYFDMQITPFLGMNTFDQIVQSGNREESAFAYGFDVTQYFFFHQHWAVRVNLHNRYYNADVRGYTTGTVTRSGDSQNTTMFLMGLTYFF